MTTETAKIKELFSRVELADAAYDAADAAWEADPENATLEKAWDNAYEVAWNAAEDFAEAIVEFTAGSIDKRTARLMLIKQRDELREYISRWY